MDIQLVAVAVIELAMVAIMVGAIVCGAVAMVREELAQRRERRAYAQRAPLRAMYQAAASIHFAESRRLKAAGDHAGAALNWALYSTAAARGCY